MLTFGNLGRLGRFANGMFQVASTIGIATKNGYDYGFPPWFNYDHKDRFGSSEDIDLQKYFINPLPICEDPGRYPERWVNWGFHGFGIPDNVSLNGHMQSPRYFNHCLPLIKNYFRMKDEPEQNNFVAIHYRAGDYQEGKESYHPRQPKEYYEKAMALFPKGTMFCIFSDAPMLDVITKLPIGVFVWPDGDYIQQFRFMKRCKHFITANSSYSLMAAILGDHPEKKIICPKLWFGEAAGGLDATDCYPENAIIL
jgi:hypothetical protein